MQGHADHYSSHDGHYAEGERFDEFEEGLALPFDLTDFEVEALRAEQVQNEFAVEALRAQTLQPELGVDHQPEAVLQVEPAVSESMDDAQLTSPAQPMVKAKAAAAKTLNPDVSRRLHPGDHGGQDPQGSGLKHRHHRGLGFKAVTDDDEDPIEDEVRVSLTGSQQLVVLGLDVIWTVCWPDTTVLTTYIHDQLQFNSVT